MNRWKGYLSWILVWSCTLLIGGLILRIGYLDATSNRPQGREQLTMRQEAKTTMTKQGITSPQQKSETGTKVLDSKTQNPEGPKRLMQTYKDFPSPVQGKLLKGVGNYYFETLESYMFHPGQDYLEPEGTIIRATHQGKVVFAGIDPLLGQKVELDCGQGWMVTYGGLDNLRVKVGQTVEKQGVLGQVGFSPGAEGMNNQTHLHYEVWDGNNVQSMVLSKET